MTRISPELFLEQVELNAPLSPEYAPEQLVVQVGRLFCSADPREFSPVQRQRFQRLYRAGLCRMVHPGDFVNPPDWLGGPRTTIRVLNCLIGRWAAYLTREEQTA